MVGSILAAMAVACLAYCLWENRRRNQQLVQALARLPCGQCGMVYGPVAAAGSQRADVTGPPAFRVLCLHCGDEAVRWVGR